MPWRMIENIRNIIAGLDLETVGGLTPIQRNRLKMLKDGSSTVDIAKAEGVVPGTVYRGIQMTEKKLPNRG